MGQWEVRRYVRNTSGEVSEIAEFIINATQIILRDSGELVFHNQGIVAAFSTWDDVRAIQETDCECRCCVQRRKVVR